MGLLTHLPPGVSIDTLPATKGEVPDGMVHTSVATPVRSNAFSAIYLAKGHQQQTMATGTGIREASANSVSSLDQLSINTAIKLTGKTWFVQLDPTTFPSYEGVISPSSIANANFAALSQAGIGWPVSDDSNDWFEDLLSVLKLYTGHSFEVCDVFGNGDSVCTVPDPYDNNVYTQNGPAKNAKGQQLVTIGNGVSGGGGGMGVVQNPPNIEYFPPMGGSGSEIECGYVNGELSVCVIKEE